MTSISANRLPTVIDRGNQIQGNHGNANIAKQAELPGWVKAAAKLLNGGSDGLDWINLAQKFGGENTHRIGYLVDNLLFWTRSS